MLLPGRLVLHAIACAPFVVVWILFLMLTLYLGVPKKKSREFGDRTPSPPMVGGEPWTIWPILICSGVMGDHRNFRTLEQIID